MRVSRRFVFFVAIRVHTRIFVVIVAVVTVVIVIVVTRERSLRPAEFDALDKPSFVRVIFLVFATILVAPAVRSVRAGPRRLQRKSTVVNPLTGQSHEVARAAELLARQKSFQERRIARIYRRQDRAHSMRVGGGGPRPRERRRDGIPRDLAGGPVTQDDACGGGNVRVSTLRIGLGEEVKAWELAKDSKDADGNRTD